MKLTRPFPDSLIGQGFGANAVAMYSGMGLKGHPGIDYNVPWSTPIPCAVNATCYATLSKNNPDPAFYRAVCTIVDDVDCSYEVIYGHCNTITVTAPTNVSTGQIIASVGNSGEVYSNVVLVSEADKLAGSHAGAHLHFQVRKLMKENENVPLDPAKHYVNDGNGLLTVNKSHYYVPEWNNGYNGCVDPSQFFDNGDDPYQKLINIANQMESTNPAQSKIIRAVAGIIKAFNT